MYLFHLFLTLINKWKKKKIYRNWFPIFFKKKKFSSSNTSFVNQIKFFQLLRKTNFSVIGKMKKKLKCADFFNKISKWKLENDKKNHLFNLCLILSFGSWVMTALMGADGEGGKLVFYRFSFIYFQFLEWFHCFFHKFRI